MQEFYLIRHGETRGNQLRRYIGTTDEPLCEEGIQGLKRKPALNPQLVFSSPLLRCRMTAELLFPSCAFRLIEELKECNFGEFENRNYLELSGNPNFQAWIDSGGTLPFPGGESREAFRERSLKGFDQVQAQCAAEGVIRAAIVTHGGVIMNILQAYSPGQSDFYDWYVKNAEGYRVWLDENQWKRQKKSFASVSPL